MSKQEYLEQLEKGLYGLPKSDIDERLAFYNESIDDRMEEGLTEEEAIADLGSVDTVIAQILEETPLSRLVRNQIKPKRSLHAWELILLILGSPIWLSFSVAFIAVILSGYAVVWVAILSVWAAEAALIGSAIGALLSIIPFGIQDHPMTQLAMLGAGLFCLGGSIFFFFGCKASTKGILWLTKKAILWIKARFVGKEAVQ